MPRSLRVPLRLAFAAAWVAAQAALVLTAGKRADAAFGFRMFNESSTIAVHLVREVEAPTGYGTVDRDVEGGEWVARDRDGNLHRVRWRDRVIEPGLATFDATMHASYGAAAQLARWRAALDDVARHTPEDAETKRLRLEITVRRNGREPQVIRYASGPR